MADAAAIPVREGDEPKRLGKPRVVLEALEERQRLLRGRHEVDRAGRVRVEPKERCVQPAACPGAFEPDYDRTFDRLVVDLGRPLELAELARHDAESHQRLDPLRIICRQELHRAREKPFCRRHIRATECTEPRRRQ